MRWAAKYSHKQMLVLSQGTKHLTRHHLPTPDCSVDVAVGLVGSMIPV